MNMINSLSVQYGAIAALLLLGIVVGALLAGLWLQWRYRRQFEAVREEVYQARQEAAIAQSQLLQMQSSAREKEAFLQQVLQQSRSQLGSEFENLANRIFDSKQQQFDQQNAKTLSSSLTPLKEKIGEFKKQVADAYQKESAERNQLVGKIEELQKQTHKIGEDAVNLALALKGDNKSQGNWGEVVLERLLEESGLVKGREYDTQVAFKDEEGKRRNPDVIIHLPDNKQLIIDSKVSLVHYECYINTTSDEERSVALKRHIDSVRQHIKDLSRKNYESLEGIQTLDFVFIFMPIEAAFMLALQEEPALFKEAYDKQIVLVSPTTLMATLRTVANIWRYHKQHKNAEKIATQAGGLYDQFALVVESLDELGGQLQKTQKSYEQTRNRLSEGRSNLIRRVELLKELGAKTKKQLPANKLEQLEEKST